jgi:hypothetical protein
LEKANIKPVRSLLCIFQTERVIFWDMERRAYPAPEITCLLR